MYKKDSSKEGYVDPSNSSQFSGWIGDSSCADSLIKQIENQTFVETSIFHEDGDSQCDPDKPTISPSVQT